MNSRQEQKDLLAIAKRKYEDEHNPSVEGVVGCNHIGLYKEGLFSVNNVRAMEKRLTNLISSMVFKTGTEHILDVGCGRCGDVISMLTQNRKASAVALDISRRILEPVIRLIRKDGSLKDRLTVRPVSIFSTGFYDKEFDSIVMTEFLQYIDTGELDHVFDEVSRLSKPNSTLVISDFITTGNESLDPRDNVLKSVYGTNAHDYQQLKDVLTSKGYDMVTYLNLSEQVRDYYSRRFIYSKNRKYKQLANHLDKQDLSYYVIEFIKKQ